MTAPASVWSHRDTLAATPPHWHADRVDTPGITIDFAPELGPFLPARRRGAPTTARVDGVSTLGHLVESLGVPLTEVGELLVDGKPASAAHIPATGQSVAVRAVTRPQPVPGSRFLLDIHLGTLARRLRLLGVDAAYEKPDIGDAALAARSAAERRILLSRDRGLLRRREIFAGAYIYSHRPAEQLDDVLSRFAPPLRPWTRCTACNGALRETDRESVRALLPAHTDHSYDSFAQCEDCGQPYWKGAHHARLDAIVMHAQQRYGA
ncbi:Mut7-C RNAse domain-containing protein [Nocardia sp. CC227C]|uniref:Mut7-C RNAse domain-containing protein n=1 Tax=Nocardia sp. CC227C TaxID=3044562 RepID=UPI00278BC74E|nr:Mut7-C RNAse domain-containing protein [Nocardia sp. CC227C]